MSEVMNIGKMLVALGYKPPPQRRGFPCPAIINGREIVSEDVPPWVETKEEVGAYIDGRKTVAERATTKHQSGSWF